jgi:endoglucanase
VVIAADPVLLAGGRLISRSLDNRIGVYVALEALRRVHERGCFEGRMAAVAAVQEEIGSKGAATAAFSLEPDLGLAVDVAHATDAQGRGEGWAAAAPGPVIGRGSTSRHGSLSSSPRPPNGSAPIQRRGIGRATWTDADAIRSRARDPRRAVSSPAPPALAGRDGRLADVRRRSN